MANGVYDRAAVKAQIIREGVGFFCDICGIDFPESSLRVQSGLRVSTFCCYEPLGLTVEREMARAEGFRKGAELTRKEAYVGKYPGRRDGLGYESRTACTEFSPDPIDLTRGGAAVTVTVTGLNLSASSTFDFGHADITATVTVDSTEQITLQVSAAIGVPLGYYDFTFDGTTVWRKRIVVRG